MSEPGLQELLSLLPGWSRFVDTYRMPAVLADSSGALAELKMRLLNLRRRLRDGPHAPLRVAFFGPTGSGKSKLFSSLIGRNLSHSGYRRPFTRRARYYVHDDWRSLAADLAGDVEIHTDAEWRHRILVDTPDFDSVEVENRAEAERVFLEADGFLFVTDALKYADASTWDYLARTHQSQKSMCIVLNKVNSPTVVESFRERYRETFRSEDNLPVVREIVVPEFDIDDETLIAPDQPSMEELRLSIQQMFEGSNDVASGQMFRKEATSLFACAETLQAEVSQRQQQISELLSRLDARQREAQERLENRLASGLEPAVRDEVYQRVVKKLDAIDVLRYPRKLIAMPVRGLKSWVQKWFSRGDDDRGGQVEEPETTDPITSETLHLLESELIRFADETRLDVLSHPGLDALLDRETFKQLRMDHAEIQERFTEHHRRFRDWVATHSRETASQITGENKVKFILSQVLFNTVLITAQLHTGGALTFFELGVDGVLSPFVAKAVGMAIGNEKVREFEQAAHEEHQRSLGEIVKAARDNFADFLQTAADGMAELGKTLDEILAYRSQQHELLAYFEAGGQPAAAPDSAPLPHDREG